MKIKLDKFKNKIKKNQKITIFLVTIIMIGVIAGTIFSLVISKDDKTLISEYIISFLSSIKDSKINNLDIFTNSITNNLSFSLVIWILGVSLIGIFIAIILLFYKSFIIGFTIGTFIINYKIGGALISFVYLFPSGIINIILFLFLTLYAIAFSFKLFYSLIKRKSLDFKPIMTKYFKLLLITTIIFIISSLYESFVMPKLLELVLNIIKRA